MNMEDIAIYLEEQGKGVRGSSIFINEMPDTCVRGILLMNRQGARIDHELIGYFNAEFMVIVRSSEYKDGSDFASDILKTMTTYIGFETPNMDIKQLLPQNTPRDYRRQVSGFWEFEFDVAIQCSMR